MVAVPPGRWLARVLDLVVRRIEVRGESMAPTYRDGQRVTAVRRWRRLRTGDVVVVRDPRAPDRWLIKRCGAVDGATIELRGDNAAASTDSREFGRVPARSIRWLVV